MKKAVLGLFVVIGFLFVACSDYETFSDGKSITVTKYKGRAKDVKIPEKINNLPVTRIEVGAFMRNEKINSITIPNSVTSMGGQVFAECTYLLSVNLPDNISSIEEQTFQDCTNLNSVNIPNSITSIGIRAFLNTGIGSITIPEGVTSIGENAFSDCKYLASITIPNSITSIGKRAFSNCKNLTSVTIGSGVKSIGDWAFSDCDRLTSITFKRANTPIENFSSDGSGRNLQYAHSRWGIGTYTRPTGDRNDRERGNWTKE